MDPRPWQIELAQPAWLVALLVLLVVWAGTRKSLTDFSRPRQALCLALRSALVVLLVLALCGPQATGVPEPSLVTSAGDSSAGVAENDEAPASAPVEAPRRVLLVSGRGAAAARLAKALGDGGLAVKVGTAPEVPDTRQRLETLDAVVLMNLPAALLSPQQMEMLRQYVAGGGGLVAVGGSEALTAGGYGGTLLEEALPVECAATRKTRRPGLAIVLVVDRSESMQEGGAIELAKEAMRGVVRLLGPEDQLGLLAFDEESRWVSPIAPVGDGSQVLARIGSITAGGRTDMAPAIEKAGLALREAFVARRHMIVLTDGVSHPADFEPLAGRVAGWGVTISTVGLGREVSRALLEDVARAGKGRFYACDDPKAVPRVFALETVSASRLGVHEGPFFATPGGPSEMLAGIDLSRAPSLLGYVETRAKAAAHVTLVGPEGDPLLAWWECGTGIAIAFTSDAEDRWAAAWLGWPEFDRFWRRVVGHAIRRARAEGPASGAQRQKPAAQHTPQPRTRTVPLWHFLLAAAAVLLVCDAGARRVP